MDRRTFLRLGGITAASLSLGIAPFAPFNPLLHEAWARGASREEAERARATYDRVAAGNPSLQHKTMGPGVACTLAPGGMLSFEVHGYCLDSNFSAPAANEPLAFRPMTNYIAPDLRELYVRIMRNALTGKGRNVDIQKIVWAIRGPAGTEWTEGFTNAERAFLNGLMPGAVDLIRTAERGSYAGGARRGGGGSGRGSQRGGGSGADALLGFLLPAIAGQLPYDIRRHSNDLMRQLQERRAEKPMPGSQFCYSELTGNGVVAKGIAKHGLTVHGVLANGSPEDFSFDPMRWVMESSRDVQAVGLPSLEGVKVGKGQTVREPDKSTQDKDRQPSDKKGPQGAQTKSGEGQDGFHEFATEPQN